MRQRSHNRTIALIVGCDSVEQIGSGTDFSIGPPCSSLLRWLQLLKRSVLRQMYLNRVLGRGRAASLVRLHRRRNGTRAAEASALGLPHTLRLGLGVRVDYGFASCSSRAARACREVAIDCLRAFPNHLRLDVVAVSLAAICPLHRVAGRCSW
jgi:hypothetical protein